MKDELPVEVYVNVVLGFGRDEIRGDTFPMVDVSTMPSMTLDAARVASRCGDHVHRRDSEPVCFAFAGFSSSYTGLTKKSRHLLAGSLCGLRLEEVGESVHTRPGGDFP